MSYLVLARKYRPQTFEEIVGQKHVTRTLSGALTSGRIAHGYLFTGTRGVGKTTVARILAKALNCKEGPTATPCNQCGSCVEIRRGISVDVFEIDGASNNSVDDVRGLREDVKYLPQKSRYKVIIIDEVHMLSTAAFNALLKTLEEPPAHVVFIFATTEAHKIPETILSRCQQYDFKLLSHKEILDHLGRIVDREGLKMGNEQLVLIARKADGSVRDALSFLDQALSFAGEEVSAAELAELFGILDRSVLLALSEKILAGRGDETLKILESLSVTVWDVKQLFGDLLEHFRNLIVANISQNPEAMINAAPEELGLLVEQAQKASYETLENLFTILLDSEDEIRFSSHPRLVLEMILLRLASSPPVQPLDELAREIGRLRRDLASGRIGGMSSASGGPGGEGRGRSLGPAPSAPGSAPRRADSLPEGVHGAESGGRVGEGLDAYIQAVKKRDSRLGASLGQARMRLDGTRVLVETPNELVLTTIQAGMGVLDELARNIFGNGISLSVSLGGRDEEKRRSQEQERREVEKEKADARLKEVYKNPLVRMIQDQFPGSELEIVPEDGPKD